MTVLWIIAGLTVFVAWYSSPWGREWLKNKSWMSWYYCSPFAERVEILLFRKSDSLLYQRFKLFLAGAWQLILGIGAIDPTPFLILIPEKYHKLVLAAPSIILAIDGIKGEIDRRWSTKPVALVAVPEAVPIPPDVKAQLAAADIQKKEAVAVVKEAESRGELK